MYVFGKSNRRKNNKIMSTAFSPAPGQVKQKCFTLIELLVDTFISTMRFFKRGDKLEVQNTPLFLKEKGGAGERENFFSREKKFSLSPAHSHFTLIELLVVIAIIAILAAILLPALQNARERGMTSNCTSRIKQFGMINMSYCNDFEGYTPKYWGGSYPWMALKNYPPVNTYKLKATVLGNDDPQKVPVFCCPKYFRHPKTATSRGTVYYGWINFEFWKRSHTNIKRVKKPSKKFMHTELALLTRYNEYNANYYRTTYNSFLHNKMMNVYHYDGHVEMYREIRPWFSVEKINKSPGFADYWDYEY